MALFFFAFAALEVSGVALADGRLLLGGLLEDRTFYVLGAVGFTLAGLA